MLSNLIIIIRNEDMQTKNTLVINDHTQCGQIAVKLAWSAKHGVDWEGLLHLLLLHGPVMSRTSHVIRISFLRWFSYVLHALQAGPSLPVSLLSSL